MRAAQGGHTETAQALAAAGAEVNAASEDGWTALVGAAVVATAVVATAMAVVAKATAVATVAAMAAAACVCVCVWEYRLGTTSGRSPPCPRSASQTL